jgi:hypothetical protein
MVKVGVYFRQSRELKPGAQLAEGEGMERDRVFAYLELAAVVKDEHQMGDVLVAKAIRSSRRAVAGWLTAPPPVSTSAPNSQS